MMNLNVLSKFMTKNETSPFRIEREENFYFAVYLHKTVLCYTASMTDAQNLINEIETLFNWNKVKNIQVMREQYKEAYQTVRPALNKYSVSNSDKSGRKIFNGNYMSTLQSNGIISYNYDGKVVEGKHISNGLAIRKENGLYRLENVFAHCMYFEMPTEEMIKAFINKAFFINWSNPDTYRIIKENQALQNYLGDLQAAIIKDTTLPEPNHHLVSQIQIVSYGVEDAEKQRVLKETMSKLNNMVGLNEIKKQIEVFFKTVAADQQLKTSNVKFEVTPLHSLFVGAAGTGKTEVARIYADILWSLGLIQERKLTEVSKEDFISSYIGQTEEKTKEVIQKAMGGVLFVDEAYMLKGIQGQQGGEGADFGKIALEMIMRAMENHREQLVVVFAGYEKEMDELLEVNQGLQSRFVFKFQFEDFTPGELAEIATRMLESKGFSTVNGSDALNELMYKKAKTGSLQGNARSVRVMVEQIIRNHKTRIVELGGDLTMIHPEDVKSLLISKSQKDAEVLKAVKESGLKKLNTLIGLNDLKKEISSWSNYVLIEQKRFEQGMSTEKPTLHMTFEGDPGTGKTTVARIVGEILKGTGLLSKGHFIEVGRSDLVAGYMGQTAAKVKELIKEAKGGILFIDEAYALVQGENDQFGREAVDTLIAEMENNREDLVVILAGYTKEIEELLKSNPGFKSRLSQRFQFVNYSAEELTELFAVRLSSLQFVLEDGGLDVAQSAIQYAKDNKLVDGNGRWVRNFIDHIKKAQANRLVAEQSLELNVITNDDILKGFKTLNA